jgi:hypothetical protein
VPTSEAQISLGGQEPVEDLLGCRADPASRQASVASCIHLFIKGNLPITRACPTPARGG